MQHTPITIQFIRDYIMHSVVCICLASGPAGGLPPADPERWLPKWQRTETKRRKKTSAAREKGAVKGSQVGGWRVRLCVAYGDCSVVRDGEGEVCDARVVPAWSDGHGSVKGGPVWVLLPCW